MDLVLKFLKEEIKLNKSDKVVIGVSSGPDSMFLLYILLEIQKELLFDIIVAHINHKVRVESEEEEKFLKDYCKEHNIIFECKRIEEYNKENFHAYAREFRYKFYEELINKYHADYLMTAHHGDDLIETILMRLTRGSTFKGYSGISLISNKDNYKIVRPLLYMTKSEIQDYNDNNNIPYYIDKSNYSSKYTRNRYRMEILPFLKEENKDVHLKFLKFSKLLEESNNYIEKVVNNVYNKVWIDNKLNILKLLKYDIFIEKLVIEKILKDNLLNITELNDKHIDSIIKLINNNKSGSEICLPDGNILIINYNYLEFKNKDSNLDYKLELKDGLVIPNGMKFISITNEENGNDTIHLESKDISLPLYVRNKRNGDYIELKGTNGKRPVSDIFIDCKINRIDRNSYPVVVDSKDKIIWIPKLKKSKYDSKNHEKCDIIIKCL